MITLQERVELESEYRLLNTQLWIARDTDTVARIRARMAQIDNLLRPLSETKTALLPQSPA